MKNRIVVLNSFTKKSRKTDQRDLDLAEQRLKKFLLESK
jgi:phage-related protein